MANSALFAKMKLSVALMTLMGHYIIRPRRNKMPCSVDVLG
jgi:hypothetical protein